ncbi:MAG TPA: right-handed parallel beta-helix repeat-containing protein [Haliangiales bacterium]|nr:right-handed parallel beta-helix repeat-containing protein [Haliangiales bacterium]
MGALDVTGPHTITVTGTCNEAVNIGNRERVTIDGGGTTVINATGTGASAINVGGSKNINISGVELTGGVFGLRVARGSEVVASDLRSHDNQFAGVRVVDHSQLRLSSATLDHNGAAGLSVDSSVVALDGAMTIANNTGTGIAGGAARISLSDAAGANSISNNGGAGIGLADGSRGNFVGNTTIQGNGGAGAQLIHTSTLNLFGATVDANGDTGINVQETSHGEISNVVVSNNGFSTTGGGVRAGENSDVFLDGGVGITGNTGFGAQAELGGVLSSLGGNVITGNTLDGVRVRRMGLAHFFAPDVISGNGGDALVCDKNSLVVGDLTGISKVKCSNIEKDTSPPAVPLASHRHAP